MKQMFNNERFSAITLVSLRNGECPVPGNIKVLGPSSSRHDHPKNRSAHSPAWTLHGSPLESTLDSPWLSTGINLRHSMALHWNQP